MRLSIVRSHHLLLLSLVLLMLAPFQSLSAQDMSQSRAYYLGYDLGTSENGSLPKKALYVSTLDEDTTQLSAADADVIQFLPESSGDRVAYVARVENQLVMDVAQSDGTTLSRLALPEAQSAVVQLYADLVWLTTVDADSVPTLQGIDADTGAVVAERKFSRSNVDVSIHPSGSWAIAYHAESGRLNILQLPAITSVSIELTGYALTAPKWSPTAPQFLMGARALDNPDDMGVLVADMTVPSVRWIDTPDFPTASRIDMNWSDQGQYIVMTAGYANSQTAPASSTLVFINAETGVSTNFDSSMTYPQVLNWSAADGYALIQGRIPAQVNSGFELFDPATAEGKTLLNVFSALEPLVFAWSPDTASLGVLGRTQEPPGYEIMTLGADTLDTTTELSTQDIGLEQSSLRWSSDGRYLIFAAPITDPKELLLDLPDGVFAIDRETGQIMRLSPDSVAIAPLTLDVQ